MLTTNAMRCLEPAAQEPRLAELSALSLPLKRVTGSGHELAHDGSPRSLTTRSSLADSAGLAGLSTTAEAASVNVAVRSPVLTTSTVSVSEWPGARALTVITAEPLADVVNETIPALMTLPVLAETARKFAP